MVGVPLRGCEGSVAHQFLDCVGIHSVLRQPRSEGLPQIMKTDLIKGLGVGLGNWNKVFLTSFSQAHFRDFNPSRQILIP